MLTLNETIRSYSGKPGCMCGCLGKYNEGERARKMAITALLKDPAVKFQAWANDSEGCLYVVTATRNRALYLNQQGVAKMRQLGYAE
jgi:hypothetical protein